MATSFRAFGRMTIVLLVAAVAGCASAPTVPQPKAEAAPVAVDTRSTFRRALDEAGLSHGIPAKGRAILVNIPSYELIAFEDGEPVLRSKVIVGRNVPGDRTPRLETETSVVRFRPQWRPTPMMVRSGKYEDRIWPPGPKNPLGLLAIRLEPGMLIYLHGTNNPGLYERDKRALSAGCVRVERWDEVAAWVLDDDVGAVHAAAYGERTFDRWTGGIPVMIRYNTRFPDPSGRMLEHEDIYGWDGART